MENILIFYLNSRKSKQMATPSNTIHYIIYKNTDELVVCSIEAKSGPACLYNTMHIQYIVYRRDGYDDIIIYTFQFSYKSKYTKCRYIKQ